MKTFEHYLFVIFAIVISAMIIHWATHGKTTAQRSNGPAFISCNCKTNHSAIQ